MLGTEKIHYSCRAVRVQIAYSSVFAEILLLTIMMNTFLEVFLYRYIYFIIDICLHKKLFKQHILFYVSKSTSELCNIHPGKTHHW